MTRTEIHDTKNNHHTSIEATTEPSGRIMLHVLTNCPVLEPFVKNRTITVDPMQELFHWDNSVLNEIAQQLPHRAYAFLFGALKAVQVEAGLTAPGRYTIDIQKQTNTQ
jgi:hypothetical protein